MSNANRERLVIPLIRPCKLAYREDCPICGAYDEFQFRTIGKVDFSEIRRKYEERHVALWHKGFNALALEPLHD